MIMHRVLLAAAASLVIGATGAAAADLPKATAKALATLKLEPGLMDGLDAELAVPKEWVDGAAKEGEVIILGTWEPRQFGAMTAPFKERYPKVNLKYSRAGTAARGMNVLVALGEGRATADVLTGIADATFQFIEMKALADLRELPGFKNAPPEYVAEDGTWASHKLSYRCLAYNTDKVKKADLPATWDDLVDSGRWHDGNLALSNEPNSWLLPLWGAKGEKWGADFTDKLFDKVKPQQRKEGMTAATSLAVAGEFDATLPAPEWVATNYAKKGAPLSYHCPAPVPITLSQIVMLEKAPHKNAARLFINWILSREGQLLQYSESSAIPVHKAMQSERFLPFPETTTGKPVMVRDDRLLGSDMQKKMLASWNSHWTAGKSSSREE
jgi:iron(III) transport system substrate-binding protein